MKRTSGLHLVLATAMAAAAFAPALVRAADYPTRDIEFIVAFPPGGPADGAARVLAPLMSVALKRTVTVVNKGGAGGIVGSDYAARAKPDGHTIYISTNSSLTITPHLRNINYKVSDFTPIGGFAADLGVVAVRNTAPARTLEEFVDYVRKNPGKLSYGSAGQGTVSHLSMELFKAAYGLDIQHVPFQGTAPVKLALMGGHVIASTSGFGSLSPLIRSGDLIALATTSPTRIAAFPNVPTMAEKGFPGASLNIWMGVYVPAKTPKEVSDVLVRTLAEVARNPALAAGLEGAGMYVDYRGPAATLQLIERESAAVAKIVDSLKLPKE